MKVDVKKELKSLYGASLKTIDIVDVPEMNFLMVDGKGNPNTAQEYKDAVEALYALSYAVKFMVKKGETGIDYGVMPLEGLWWADDMNDFIAGNKDRWKWTSMIMQPKYVSGDLINQAIVEVSRKKNLVSLDKVRFESFREGLVAQLMHLGSYSDEAPTIERLHHYIEESGYQLVGKHHEIYLSDPRRSAPEKLKTIVRQPIRKLKR
jgi:hypothetical protein